MKKNLWAALAMTSMLALAAAAFWASRTDPANLNVLDLLAAPRTAMQLRLLAAPRNADGTPISEFETSEDYYDVPALRNLAQQRHTRPDGSNIIDYYRPGPHNPSKLLTLVYGPKTEGLRPQLIEKTSFADDGTTKTSDVVYDNYTGLRTKSSIRDSQGNYTNRTYFADGDSIDEEDIVGTGGGYDKVQVVRRFSYEKHVLISLTLLNADGSSRTVTEYGLDSLPLKVTTTGAGSNKADGESVVAYFPGTKIVRLKSATDKSGTHASYFHEDGTLKSTWEMTRDHLTVTSYDPSGKRVVLVQVFDEVSFNTETVNLLDVDHTTWKPTKVSEKGVDGQDARVFTFVDGKPVEQKGKDSPKTEDASLPASETNLDTSDNLPLPPPQYTYGPYGGYGGWYGGH